MAYLPIALQLYTVRGSLETDTENTLRRVKEAGYDHVEVAGLAHHTAQSFKALLDDAGLTAVAAHWGYEVVSTHLDRVVEEAGILGVRHAVVPWLGGEVCPDKAGWLKATEVMDRAGASLRKQGLQLCYHNHAHEFELIEGEYIFDLIFANSAPDHLASELDTCWAAVGGHDPVALIQEHSGRVPLLHIKDYKPGPPLKLAEVGTGCIPWDAVFAAGLKAGTEWFIIEQDETELDPLESVAISGDFIKRWTPQPR